MPHSSLMYAGGQQAVSFRVSYCHASQAMILLKTNEINMINRCFVMGEDLVALD